jgi:hypothetical protein
VVIIEQASNKIEAGRELKYTSRRLMHHGQVGVKNEMKTAVFADTRSNLKIEPLCSCSEASGEVWRRVWAEQLFYGNGIGPVSISFKKSDHLSITHKAVTFISPLYAIYCYCKAKGH